jgi:hypothetical protein
MGAAKAKDVSFETMEETEDKKKESDCPRNPRGASDPDKRITKRLLETLQHTATK